VTFVAIPFMSFSMLTIINMSDCPKKRHLSESIYKGKYVGGICEIVTY